MPDAIAMGETTKPSIRRINRREFSLLVGGAGLAVAAAVGLVRVGKDHSSSTTASDPGGVPVRNPAFRSVPGRVAGHIVLFCQGPDGNALAFELNQAGAKIWDQCATGEEIAAGKPGCPVAGMAATAGMDAEEAAMFVARMEGAGLVYLAGSATRVYFERQIQT